MHIEHERRTGRDRRQYDRELPFWMDQELVIDRRSYVLNEDEMFTPDVGRSSFSWNTFVRNPAD